MDKEGLGYVNLDDLYKLLNEEPCSVVSPYIEKFYMMIDKETNDKMSFLELVSVVGKFCLYTREQILNFVFLLIDTNTDGFISKRDIIKFLTIERFGKKLFPYNHLIAVDFLDVERSDRISFQQFISLEREFLYLTYPAVRFQTELKAQFGGQQLWINIYNRIVAVENEESNKANFGFDYTNDAIRKKRFTRPNQKIKDFDEFIKNRKKDPEPEYKVRHFAGREAKRRGSDARLNLKLPVRMAIEPKKHNSVILRKSEFIVVKVEKRRVFDFTKTNFSRNIKKSNSSPENRRINKRSATLFVKQPAIDEETPTSERDSTTKRESTKGGSNLSSKDVVISNRRSRMSRFNTVVGSPTLSPPDNSPMLKDSSRGFTLARLAQGSNIKLKRRMSADKEIIEVHTEDG